VLAHPDKVLVRASSRDWGWRSRVVTGLEEHVHLEEQLGTVGRQIGAWAVAGPVDQSRLQEAVDERLEADAEAMLIRIRALRAIYFTQVITTGGGGASF